MNVMEDNEYDTNDRRRNLLLTTSSLGSFHRKLGGTPPLLFFFLGGGGGAWGGGCMTDTLYAGSIISHCSANEPVLQETGPTTAGNRTYILRKKRSFKCRNDQFYSQMHIP